MSASNFASVETDIVAWGSVITAGGVDREFIDHLVIWQRQQINDARGQRTRCQRPARVLGAFQRAVEGAVDDSRHHRGESYAAVTHFPMQRGAEAEQSEIAAHIRR